jgi:DNA polymerase I-like protein with 3'-5' exonuclease and polymerase domains
MHGIDVETTALDPAEGDLRLVQLSDSSRALVYDYYKQDADVIRGAIEARDELVAHNAVFERAWIADKLGVDLGDLDDTMIMSQVYHTGTKASKRKGFSHSLANVAKRELKVELAKDEQVSDWGAVALTREQIEYAARDAAVLPKLAETLMRKIKRAGLLKTYELERRVSHAVDAMQRRGVAIHTDRLEAMIAESTSVEKWLRWKEIEKIRSTYGESLLKRLTPEGRIHARFKAFGTATGRFSSSGPNLQNIPKRDERGARMRGLFWSAADDRVLIKADYASIELWVVAVL